MTKKASAEPLRALLFDKDGTLFDFNATWATFGARVIEQLAAGAPDRMQELADAIGLDLARGAFRPESPAIAGGSNDVVRALARRLPEWRSDALAAWLRQEARAVGGRSLTPATPALDALLGELCAAGYVLGVATNDAGAAARAQLREARIAARFAFIAGYDDVGRPKPAPDLITAFAAATDTPPGAIAMIGDSVADLLAARRAGCGAAIGVLTGPTTAETLAPLADAVLGSIAEAPDWLANRATKELEK